MPTDNNDEKRNATAEPNIETVSPPEGEQKLDGWPPEPASLGKTGFSRYLGIITDVGCILAAFPFLVLAGAAARLNDQLVSARQWSTIYAAMNAAVTVFPIAYTTILARTVKTFATWKFERGTTLGYLEQLLASRSLVGALQVLWSLRVLNVVGVFLVVLAIISPLGGQAALQMLKTEERPDVSQPLVAYLTTEEGSYSQFESGTYFWYALPALNAMYASSIAGPPSVKNSTMDLWGNVKIPYLSRLHSSADSEGWQDVPTDAILDKYSSLIGIPVSGVSASANASFTMETSYFDLDCYNVTNGTAVKTLVANGPTGNTPNGSFWGYGSTSSYSLAIDGILAMSYGPVWGYVNKTNLTYAQRTILFQSIADFGRTTTLAYCHISTAYVEAAVNCTGLTCGVTRMRPSQQRHPDPHLVPFEFGYYLNGFEWQFPQATNIAGGSAPETSTPTEFFLNNPMNPFANTYRVIVDLYMLSGEDMAVRLGQLINSYYLGSLSPWGITGQTVDSDGSNSGGGSTPLATTVNATSVTSVNTVVYVCQWGWWVIFVLACLVMLATAALGAVLHRASTGPDILGYVSSMTRDSPYVQLAPGGSALDGTDRARLLKGLKVQLRDVQEGNGTGRLAFVSREGWSGAPAVDRMYQ